MRFEHTNRYAATPSEVLAMLTTPAFRERVCEQQHALDHSVEISGSGVGATVVITQSQSMKSAPGVARKLTGDSVEIVQREVWRTADAADFAMEIPGKPGHLHGTVALRETATGCEEVFAGEVKVSIPLVGGKLEGLIGEILRKALRREGEVGVTWLAERG
jgi:hypothetical protein